MKILVTGGAGFVGTNLIKRLLKDGHKITSIDNYSTGKKENEQDGCIYLNADLSQSIPKHGSWGQVKFEVEQPDIIFHMAAIARIQPSFKNPIQSFENNTTATLNLLEWARESNCPIIFAGSSSSNGDKLANPYTLSKSQAEQIVQLYNKIYELPTTICRFYNVYGPHQLTEGEYCTLIGIFERLKKEDEIFTVTGTGEQRRDFTHIDDIVDALIKCGEKHFFDGGSEINGQTLELGRGKNYSVMEIVKAFGEEVVRYLPARPGEMKETLCTDTKAKELLGWKPTINVVDYIKEILT